MVDFIILQHVFKDVGDLLGYKTEGKNLKKEDDESNVSETHEDNVYKTRENNVISACPKLLLNKVLNRPTSRVRIDTKAASPLMWRHQSPFHR